jgi:hypothetical protein
MMMPMVVAMISTHPIKMARSLALLGGGFILSIVNDVRSPDGNQGDLRNPPLTELLLTGSQQMEWHIEALNQLIRKP